MEPMTRKTAPHVQLLTAREIGAVLSTREKKPMQTFWSFATVGLSLCVLAVQPTHGQSDNRTDLARHVDDQRGFQCGTNVLAATGMTFRSHADTADGALI